MPRYPSSTDKKHNSNNLPYPSTGILSRLKGYFFKDKPTTTSTTLTTTPAPAPSAPSTTTSPSFIAPPDISTVSNLSTRNPNDTLSEFFNRKGDEPLSEIEVEGVLSLIRKAQSQSRTASANHSLLTSFDAGNNTTTVLRRASSHLPKPVTVPTPTFKSRVKTQPSSRTTSFASTSFSGTGVSKRRIISYNALDAPFNIKHRGLKSFIERKKREVENKDTTKTTIYKGGKIDLNFEDTPVPTVETTVSTPHISSTANSVLAVLNELEQSKEEKEQKEKEQKEKEQKEKEQKEKEQKEKEQKEKEQKEREQKEREQKEREQQEREQQEREQKEREQKEREQKEREQKEREQKEKGQREKDQMEKIQKEREQREKEQKQKKTQLKVIQENKGKEEEKVDFSTVEHHNTTSPIIEEKLLLEKDVQTATQSMKNPVSSFTFSSNETPQSSSSKNKSTTTVEVIESFVFPQISPAKPKFVQNQSQHSVQTSPQIFKFPEVPPASPSLIKHIASLKDDYKDVFTF